MDNGLQITMSPVQLAAVLSDKTVTESETLSGRLMGGLELVLGSLELAGATALCMVPEPTGLTKAACIVGGTHSLDSINTAAQRVITGHDTRTATYRTAVALAKQFGADDQTAWKIGITVDIAVPAAFSLAVGAAIIYWANTSASTKPLELTWRAGTSVGYGFRQGKNIKETSSVVRVVLLKKTYSGKPYYVLSSYPFMG